MMPLKGVRIVELAESVAGEYCGKLLADFGQRDDAGGDEKSFHGSDPTGRRAKTKWPRLRRRPRLRRTMPKVSLGAEDRAAGAMACLKGRPSVLTPAPPISRRSTVCYSPMTDSALEIVHRRRQGKAKVPACDALQRPISFFRSGLR